MNYSQYILSLLLIGLVLGCTTSKDVGVNPPPVDTPSELVKLALQEVDEFEFCLSEDADAETLQESMTRLNYLVGNLGKSVSPDGTGQTGVKEAFESLETSVVGLADSLQQQVSPAGLSSAGSEIRRKLNSISDLID